MLDKPSSSRRSVWHDWASLYLNKPCTVVYVHSYFLTSTKFEEHSSVEFKVILIKVTSKVFTEYCDTKNWGDVVLAKRAQRWFSNLGVETGAALNIYVFVMIFCGDCEVLDMSIAVYTCSLFDFIKFKVGNSGLNTSSVSSGNTMESQVIIVNWVISVTLSNGRSRYLRFISMIMNTRAV